MSAFSFFSLILFWSLFFFLLLITFLVLILWQFKKRYWPTKVVALVDYLLLALIFSGVLVIDFASMMATEEMDFYGIASSVFLLGLCCFFWRKLLQALYNFRDRDADAQGIQD